MNYCLEHGTPLMPLLEEDTMEFPSRATLIRNDEPTDADKRIDSLLEEIYKTESCKRFKHDARFERLISRYRLRGFDFVFNFLERFLYQAASNRMVFDRYAEQDMEEALTHKDHNRVDEILESRGLI